MAINIPTSLPPPSLYPKILPHLIRQLEDVQPSPTTLPLLRTTLHILASIQLALSPTPTAGSADVVNPQSTIPLQRLLDFSSAQPKLLKVVTLLDGIIAYPLHLTTLNDILSNAFGANADLIEIFRIDIIPSLINRLNEGDGSNIAKATKILLSVIRAHDELLALALEDSENLLKSLSKAYKMIQAYTPENIRVKVKSDILMICKELLDSVPVGHETVEEAMVKFMGNPSDGKSGLLESGNSLRDDWEALFERDEDLSDKVKNALQQQRDEEAIRDPRVKHLIQLFPTLPPHLLLSALSHPMFASLPEGSRATPAEQASSIVDVIFSGGEGLPDDLSDFKIAIQGLSQEEPSLPAAEAEVVTTQSNSARAKASRRNIFDDEELDISKLRLKEDETTLPTLSNAIPDTLRASIMRLVENQAVEEEERRRALKEANLLDDEDDYEEGDDGVVSRIKVGGDTRGDEDDDEISEEDGVKISREASGAATPSGPSDRQRLDILRTAYITNQKVFERDGATRRSNDRKKLREATGWDDGQIEGWRIMLERDPHKEDILAAHADKISRSRAASAPRQRNDGPTRGGGGGNRGGRGRGGGGSGGRGGGGGGRGGSKSNRGHSNAARTRGHDKKMSKMGAV